MLNFGDMAAFDSCGDAYVVVLNAHRAPVFKGDVGHAAKNGIPCLGRLNLKVSGSADCQSSILGGDHYGFRRFGRFREGFLEKNCALSGL